MNNPIGILIDNFHMETVQAIRIAAELGANGIQFYARDNMSPENLTPEKRREFKAFVNSLGMEICSVVCGGNFKTEETVEESVLLLKQSLELAVDLGATNVAGHIGVIPSAPAHPRYKRMLAACKEVAEYAASIGAVFAIETGPEIAYVLRSFMEDIDSDGIGVNLDPANIVMITGENPADSVRRLNKKIVATHVKDGMMNWFCDPEIAYGMVPDVNNLKAGHRTQTPLGEGAVPWKEYFAALDEIGYSGYLTIERESGDDRESEIRRAYKWLLENR